MLGPITTGIDDKFLSQEEYEVLKHPLINGVILFSRNYEDRDQLLALTNSIKAINPKLLVSVDHEGGRVQRFRDGFSQLPSMSDAFQLENASEKLHDIGWTLAAELLACKVDFSYAPCVDVNGISQVIGNRAFSSEPEKVVAGAKALIKGLHSAGMKSVIKHFPGHGSVGPDSHIAMPVDDRSIADITEYDLVPFKRLVAESLADAVMPAHVIYSEVDKNPACFSDFWLKTVLRKQLGFNGPVISDDMGMQGAVQVGDYPTRVAKALDAGCDTVLLCNEKPGLYQVMDSLPIEKYQHHGARMAVFHQKTYPSWDDVKRDQRWHNCQKIINS